MITEEARQHRNAEEINEKLQFNDQIIVAAAKYERLASNKDFLAVLEEIRQVKEILDRELITLSKQIAVTDNPVERETVQNEFIFKSIRRIVIDEAYSYPNRIIHQAAVAKEENTALKIELKDNSNG